jgi:hypothetical protein
MRVEYLAARMTKAVGLRRLRTAARAAGGALALLLALAVFSVGAQAEQHYVYCNAMQEVMLHACCEGLESNVGKSTPAPAVLPPDCCQARTMPALDVWSQAARAVQQSTPLVAVAWPPAVDLATFGIAPLSNRAWAIRTGPPGSRMLARLMVFRI